MVRHVAADAREVGDSAVVHEDVAAEDEGVAIHLRDDAAAGRPDVSEKTVGLGVAAKVAEVEIADGWGLRLVQGGSTACHSPDIVFGGVGVPCHAQAVHVEEAVPHFEEVIRGVIELGLFAMGEQAG